MKNKNFGRKRQAIYILSNRKSTRIIKTLMDFFFFIKVKIKMVCFSVPSILCYLLFFPIPSSQPIWKYAHSYRRSGNNESPKTDAFPLSVNVNRLNLLQSKFHIIICKIITRKIDHLVTHIINIRIINNLCTNIWQIN